MTSRTRLPNRRQAETVTFEHGTKRYHATFGYAHGRLAEVFLCAAKVASESNDIAQDAGIACSLAFQHGAALETLRAALGRGDDGRPVTVLGAALALAVEETHPPPAPG